MTMVDAKITVKAQAGSKSATFTVTVTGKEHDYVPDYTWEATCICAGYTIYRCETCGQEELRDYVPANGHDFGEWSDADTDGVEHRFCAVCTFRESREAATIPFSDVKETDYFLEPVLWAVEQEITAGTGHGLFSPNTPCTRAQVVTFLWRAMGSPASEAEVSFTDVLADLEAAGDLTIIAHIGALSTKDSVELARHAAKCGAHAVSSVTPLSSKGMRMLLSRKSTQGAPWWVYSMGS